MTRLSGASGVLVAWLVASCGGMQEEGQPGEKAESPGAVEKGGTTYTPVSTSTEGCVLYNIHIENGRAPAALVYQNSEGEFSYAPPKDCVKTGGDPMEKLVHPADADVWEEGVVPPVELAHRFPGGLIELREQAPQIVCPVRMRPLATCVPFAVLLNGKVIELLDRQSPVLCDEVFDRLLKAAVRGGDRLPVLGEGRARMELVDHRVAFQSCLGSAVGCEEALYLFTPPLIRYRHLRDVIPVLAGLHPILLVDTVRKAGGSRDVEGTRITAGVPGAG